MPNAAAEKQKSIGNDFFRRGQYREAIAQYEKAAAIDRTNAAYHSNIAASYEKLKMWKESADAASNCIKTNKTFLKGYFRLATAQQALKDHAGAQKTLEEGLVYDANNKDLKKMKADLVEKQRADKVSSYCRKADEQMANGDIPGAYKTLELASRLGAGNVEIERMMSKVRPRYEAIERKRKAGLSGTEGLKEKGDEAYKAAQFENAVCFYSKCLDSLGEFSSSLAIKCLSNRAACYKQISNFDGTISDCTYVLEVEPENVKALVRRAQAFEAVEKYRYALQDVKQVLSMPFNSIGRVNYELCNGLQHRLNRVVAQLKKG
uniref:Uncharacterized protein n=1 Tax=Corethron hystrix TaxID=216773 RepID=A0A7S1BD40_9STRA|mmetsp:Transcript_21705/g.49351  ORF Transcript_21705/g.49351 Transcript_21705/m.49351 type:complete len:320 (+) Transcript_21705:171-1130(+)|eukprot:CAMPEP_0113297938 /NCGR_PEP_ID=MMETSP0010_2-20120614/589_1 /TAXON_ID=216773 ORGANISM="Corethron hystrix, Strain 308" /NCGR_SAMPLE_ID=MMETSP0010_2 /ASSEMBLY_ACC=CAM_ASM_000155 /LENGTH=319 /DNA_ID=CAMNT_0000150905 /DNA_START=120 /DNA_END=1079 /DNA_ORIENTATION=- /assembly_acc=CAM_ASM_000155